MTAPVLILSLFIVPFTSESSPSFDELKASCAACGLDLLGLYFDNTDGGYCAWGSGDAEQFPLALALRLPRQVILN